MTHRHTMKEGPSALTDSCDDVAVEPQRPDECLHDYLLRTQHAQTAIVEALYHLVDAQRLALDDIPHRVRRHVDMVLAGQTGFALAPVVLAFAYPGADFMSTLSLLLAAGLAPVTAGLFVSRILLARAESAKRRAEGRP